MCAITYSRFGPASEVLGLADLARPDPGTGEVLVRLKTSGRRAGSAIPAV